MEDWMLGPPLLIGDRIAYSHRSGAYLNGTVRWMGRVIPKMPEFGNQMVAGVELVTSLCLSKFRPDVFLP